MEDFPSIERVHRIGKFDTMRTERVRDLIVRFRFYEDKNNIWVKLRGKTPLQFEGAKIQVFVDLAKDTLVRRRHLKPLLEQMIKQNVKYSWGFLACLLGSKDGRSARLRFPEELGEFCGKLGLQAPPRCRIGLMNNGLTWDRATCKINGGVRGGTVCWKGII